MPGKLFFLIVLYSNMHETDCSKTESRNLYQHQLLGHVEPDFLLSRHHYSAHPAETATGKTYGIHRRWWQGGNKGCCRCSVAGLGVRLGNWVWSNRGRSEDSHPTVFTLRNGLGARLARNIIEIGNWDKAISGWIELWGRKDLWDPLAMGLGKVVTSVLFQSWGWESGIGIVGMEGDVKIPLPKLN